MSLSERQKLIRDIRRILDPAGRLVPMWARLRVWRKDAAERPYPAEPLPRLYGGLWDRLEGRYVPGAQPGPGDVTEISCTEDQLKIALYQGTEREVIILGGPGAGKTRGLAIWLTLQALETPHRDWGVIGATMDRVGQDGPVWEEFVKIFAGTRWVDDTSAKPPMIQLVNGRLLFRAAKEQSRALGSPFQGLTLEGAIADESQNINDKGLRDLLERGRSAGKRFRSMQGATLVDDIAEFTRRLATAEQSKRQRVLRLNPLANPFVEQAHWDDIRASYTDHFWRRRIMSEPIPPEGRIYSAYLHSAAGNLRPRPKPKADDPTYKDVTAELAQTVRGAGPRRYIVGQDWGRLTSASEVLKVFRHMGSGKLHWWIVGEVWSGSHATTELHGRRLLERFPAEEIVVIADPAVNTKDVDKSDFAIFRSMGIFVVPASARTIYRKHRWQMLNGLLCNAAGERRLFVDVDESGKPAAPKFCESCLTMEADENGEPAHRKNFQDPSHWPDAVSFGTYPFEQLNGPSVWTSGVMPGRRE